MTDAQQSARPYEYPRSRVIAAFAAVYVVWGSTYLAIRYAVMTIPPFLMVGTRFLVSGVLLQRLVHVAGGAGPRGVVIGGQHRHVVEVGVLRGQ